MNEILLSIGVIFVCGVGAQWLAWKIRFPSIVLLLICGFVAGPVFGLVNTDLLQNELLYAIVAVSVAIILFEGSLRLKISELRECGKAIFRLLTVAAGITWILCSIAAHYLFDFSLEISVLFGAIFIVTGPTVIQPLLRSIRPAGRIGTILKWEGIAIDTVGALAAVMVYEFILADGFRKAITVVGFGVFKTFLMGIVIGIVAAGILILFIKRYWIPEFLQNAFALTVVIGSFVLVSVTHNEPTGFLTVTVIGIVLANQNFISILNILKFKEDLRTLLLPMLFIVLAAKVPMGDLSYIDVKAWIFVIALIVVVRPLSIFVATWKSDLTLKEKIFLSSVAPRGVVAAAVASIFATKLAAGGYVEAQRLIISSFFVIVTTVFIYGFCSPLIAKFLKIAQEGKGIIILGAHAWARRIARSLVDAGIFVVMVDSNLDHVLAGREEGLDVLNGNFLDEHIFEDIDLSKMGCVLALTENNEANSLGLLELSDSFEKNALFQLAHQGTQSGRRKQGAFHGRVLFKANADFQTLDAMFDNGAKIVSLPFVENVKYEEKYSIFVPLYTLDLKKKDVMVISAEQAVALKPDRILIALVKE